MEVFSKNNNIIIRSCCNFDIDQVFDCGQCFRFEKTDGVYTGVALGRRISLKQDGDTVILYDTTQDEFDKKWRYYFDLDRDYAAVIGELSFDERIRTAVQKTGGIRILRQDGWETLCSFIISQLNNIPRIKKIIASLCRLLGEAIGDDTYTFPSAERVAAAGIEGLAPIKSGFRTKFIYDAATKVSQGVVDLEAIPKMSYSEAKRTLMTIKGVGEKVADCVLLFGFGFYEAFPRDVWVKRILSNYYGEDFTPEYFGKNAGIAQQYLFYYERSFSKKESSQKESTEKVLC
jgi:N-glycosylase/DNA lyase